MVDLGFDESTIVFHKDQHLITSTRPAPDANNKNGCLIYTNTLNYMFTTRNQSGNLFTLVMDMRSLNFPECLKYIAKTIGAKISNKKITLPFGGFYKGILSTTSQNDCELKEYPESALPDPCNYSRKFLNDGISLKVQEEWGIRYDHDDDSILIPIYDYVGRLIGCKARNNDPNCDFSRRWYAYLPYSKTHVIYGWYQNYHDIINSKKVIIVESEKSVLQAASMGIRNVVAIGGHNISTTQAKYIKSLMVEEIIIAFDEDIDEDTLEEEAYKLRMKNKIWKNTVGYITDHDHDIILRGSKASPTDLGMENFQKLLSEYVIWVK